jgi:hypothetical protein
MRLSNVRLVGTVAVVTAAMLLTGCTAAIDHPAATPIPTVKTVPGLPAGVTPAKIIPTAVPNDVTARAAVRVTGCAASTGGWTAGGTVTNPGKKAKSYTITVFFTTASATVIDTAETKLTVAAGQESKWSATKRFVTAPGMLCVLRGVA